MKICKEKAEHYIWGEICDGWHLVKSDELSIIHERMPPNTSEVKHIHQKSKQFFYILSGEATMEIEEKEIKIHENEGIEVNPGNPHQMFNKSNADVEFLVISSPSTKGDRIVI